MFRTGWSGGFPTSATCANRLGAWGCDSSLAYVMLISAWIALLLVVGTRVEKEDPDIIRLTKPFLVQRPPERWAAPLAVSSGGNPF